MSYNIATLKADLEASLHGTSLNKVTNINGIFNRAASQLLFDLDPQETKRTVAMASPIFSNVYDYYLPNDLKGNKIIDIRPQANRKLTDRYPQVYNQDFSLGKYQSTQPMWTLNFNSGYKTVKIENNLIASGINLNNADTVNGNGTWVASVGASNLDQDNLVVVDGQSSSLSFDITGTQAVLTNSTFSSLDCSSQNDQASIFFFVYLPTASDFTTVQIKWGTDASNYWLKTINSTNVGTVLQDGWNLLQADWQTAIQVGSTDNSDIGYLQVIWNYSSTTQVGVRLNSIYSRLGVMSEIEYYSKFMFRDATTGVFQETVTSDSNIVNLDTETRNLFFYLVGSYAVQQIQGIDAQFFDSNFFDQKYQNGLFRYKQLYKSEVQKPQTSYYDMQDNSYRKFIGRRYY